MLRPKQNEAADQIADQVVDPQTFHSQDFERIINEAIEFLEHSPLHILPITEKFKWSGVYCLYYEGPFDLYSGYSFDNPRPIYIGKSVPPGWQKARAKVSKVNYQLFRRLNDHCKSIELAENLNLDDFRCRYMILEPSLISTVESAMINKHKSLWNCFLTGFGNHDQGRSRRGQKKPAWDHLHSGRVWSSLMNSDLDIEQVRREIIEFEGNLRNG